MNASHFPILSDPDRRGTDNAKPRLGRKVTIIAIYR